MRRTTRRRRAVRALNDISMTPMIDTALTLLIIFMITTPMIQNSIRVTLPRGQVKEDGGVQQELVVYIDQQGDFYLNTIKVDRTSLIEQIKEQLGAEQEKTVFVKADTLVAYGVVLELVDQIKVVGGVKYVALATQKRTQAASSLA